MHQNPAKAAAKSLLGFVGQTLNRTLGVVPAWSFVLARLKEQGFKPATVFDIGVARGTPDLYAAFPDARYYLVDPTRESVPYMERIARQLDAKIVNVALGDRDGEIEMVVRPDDIGGSSLYEEIGPLGATTRYAVPMRRFDAAIGEFARPALCKIDVQGAEMSVLQGMGARLQEIDVFIVESSVLATIKDGPEVAEVIGFFAREGFVLYDVLGGTRRPLDRALAQLDLMFIKEDAPLRADRRWHAHA